MPWKVVVLCSYVECAPFVVNGNKLHKLWHSHLLKYCEVSYTAIQAHLNTSQLQN